MPARLTYVTYPISVLPISHGPALQKELELPSYRLSISEGSGRLSLSVRDKSTNLVKWSTPSHLPLFKVIESVAVLSDHHQSLTWKEQKGHLVQGRTCENFDKINFLRLSKNELKLNGLVTGKNCFYRFELLFTEMSASDIKVTISLKVEKTYPKVFRRGHSLSLPLHPFILLNLNSESSETIHGLGSQMTFFNHKGQLVPLVVSEQGLGRGQDDFLFNWLELIAPGSTGTPYSSYAPSPVFITSTNRGLVLENYELAFFDFRPRTYFTAGVRTNNLSAHLIAHKSFPETLTALTEHTGRMRPLPEWFNQGIILGIQGGKARVNEAIKTLHQKGVKIAGVWVQDWVGKRHETRLNGLLTIGSFLWWNWEPDTNMYGDWQRFIKNMNQMGIEVLSYINPFLVDTSKRSDAKRNLFREAKDKGILVKKDALAPYLLEVIVFEAALVDLFHFEAKNWIKNILNDHFFAPGVKGYMADFAEAFPLDAEIFQHMDPVEAHNRYPEEWSRLHLDASLEAGVSDAVFFSRSGYRQSPGLTKLFWLGDQMTSWDRWDGLHSSLIGLLSGGLSGQTLNHSDIGGYAAISAGPLGTIKRSKELFMRWAEMNAFTAAFRTHEGNRPDLNHQFDSDQETLEHFAKFARLYESLASYRKVLMKEAFEKGWPLVRPMVFYYPQHEEARVMDSQFFLGPSLLVAPALSPGQTSTSVWLPEGLWVHLWSRKNFHLNHPVRITVDSPLGQPAVFYRKDHASLLRPLLVSH